MAIENIIAGPVGLVAGADLSAKQFLFVKKTSTAMQVDVCGDGELMIGVLQNKPTSGQAASVAGVGSTARVICGAAVTSGGKVASDSAGKAVPAADGDWMAGIALDTTANADEYVSVYLCPVCLGIDDDT